MAAKKESASKKAPKKRVAKKKAATKSTARRKASPKAAAKKVASQLRDSEPTLKQIWLAGLGAYGASVDSLQERAGKIRKERREMFDQLVERGQQMQEETNLALSQKVEEVEGRIEKIKQQLEDSYSTTLIAKSVEQVSAKLDKLQEKKKR